MNEKIGAHSEADFAGFLEVVREILKHLHNFVYLQNSTIIKEFAETMPGAGDIMVLHDQVLVALESLNPGPHTNFREPKARIFNLLQLHYIEKLLIQHSADELAISLRQAHRDLRQGEEALARILWEQWEGEKDAPLAIDSDAPEAHDEELAQIDSQNELVNIIALLKRAFQTVEQLAQSLSLHCTLALAVNDFVISTSLPLAQQALISIFSQIVRHTGASRLDITASVTKDQLGVQFRYDVASPPDNRFEFDSIVMNLLQRLQWDVAQLCEEGDEILTLHIARARSSILVIDDNEGLVSLISRYLSTHSCRIVGVTDGREGISLAQTLKPDAIILDIMMPKMDGWEILQTLRAIPALANTPVLVCSVFNEPELAAALGASLFLPKPINQQSITNALKRLNVI